MSKSTLLADFARMAGIPVASTGHKKINGFNVQFAVLDEHAGVSLAELHPGRVMELMRNGHMKLVVDHDQIVEEITDALLFTEDAAPGTVPRVVAECLRDAEKQLGVLAQRRGPARYRRNRRWCDEH